MSTKVDLFNSPYVKIKGVDVASELMRMPTITVMLEVYPEDSEMMDIYLTALQEKMYEK